MKSLHSNHDGDEFHHPIIAVPLHPFQILEERLVEAGIVLPARGRFLPYDAWAILHHHDIEISGSGWDERGASGEGPAHLVAAKHGAMHACASLSAPEEPVAL